MHRWLFIPIPGVSSKRCSCGKYIDNLCFHITNLAPCKGIRQIIHDHVLNEFFKMVRILGNYAQKEQISNSYNGCRSDIVIYDHGWQIDIATTSVSNSQTISMAKALIEERMASATFLKKISKYGKHPLVEGHIIKPIVFENTGRLEYRGQKLIKDLVKIAYSDTKSIDIVYNYWLQRINLCFWKANARAMDTRLKKLNCANIHKYDSGHTILSEGILEFSQDV